RRLPEQFFSINGKYPVCTNTEAYTLSTIPASDTRFTWQLTGGGTLLDTIGGIATASVSWTKPGTYQLIATASNSCGTGYSYSRSIRVFGSIPIKTPIIS